MANIIAFTGKMGSGKTTAVNYLADELVKKGYTFERINIKSAIIPSMKRYMSDSIAYLINQFSFDSAEELLSKKPEITRSIMRDFGLMMRELFGENYWVDQYKKLVDESKADYVLTDDIRFLSELNLVRELGQTVVRLIRTGVIHFDTHQSETDLDGLEMETIEAENEEELQRGLDFILKDIPYKSI